MLGKKTPLTILFWSLFYPLFSLAGESIYQVRSISENFGLFLTNGQQFIFQDLRLPDKHFPTLKNQCFLSNMEDWFDDEVLGHEVLIKNNDSSKRVRNRPKYITGDLKVKNSFNLKEALLKKGWAHYQGENEMLRRIEAQAQEEKVGLWGQCIHYKNLNKALNDRGKSDFFIKRPQLLGPVTVGWVRSILNEEEIELYSGLKVKLLGVELNRNEEPDLNHCLERGALKKMKELLLNKKIILKKDIYHADGYRSLRRHVVLPKNRYQSEILVTESLISSGFYVPSNEKVKLAYKRKFTRASNLSALPRSVYACFEEGTDFIEPVLTYDESCPYKGNISGSKAKPIKTYHTPLSGWYNRLKPEKCFETEAGALEAGFSKIR